jgi:hypothetical protein
VNVRFELDFRRDRVELRQRVVPGVGLLIVHASILTAPMIFLKSCDTRVRQTHSKDAMKFCSLSLACCFQVRRARKTSRLCRKSLCPARRFWWPMIPRKSRDFSGRISEKQWQRQPSMANKARRNPQGRAAWRAKQSRNAQSRFFAGRPNNRRSRRARRRFALSQRVERRGRARVGATKLSFEFSPDGRLFASTFEGKTTIREVESNREIAIIESPITRTGYAQLQFSPDNSRLAVYGYGSPLEVWEVASGRRVFNFDAGKNIVRVRFLLAGLFVASRTENSPIRSCCAVRFQGRELESEVFKAQNTSNLQFRFVDETVFIEAGYQTRSDQPSYFAWDAKGNFTRVAAARWNTLAPKTSPKKPLRVPVRCAFVRAWTEKLWSATAPIFGTAQRESWNGLWRPL